MTITYERLREMLYYRADNISGFKGARKRENGRFQARIQIDSTRRHLGDYDTAVEAHAAYSQAATNHHGEFARTS